MSFEKKIDNLIDWIKDNKDQVMIVLAVFFFIVLLVPLVINYHYNTNKKLWDMYARAQMDYYNGDMNKALQYVDGIVKKKKKSAASRLALILKGNILYHGRAYSESEAAFKEFLNLYKNDYLGDMVLDNLAYSLEMQEKYQDAIDAWGQIINDYSDSYLVPNAYKGQARCYEGLNNTDKAKEIYQLIVNMFPDTISAEEAKTRLDYLEKN